MGVIWYLPVGRWQSSCHGLDGACAGNLPPGMPSGARRLMGRRSIVASMDHHIYALDPQSGEQIW
jgi:hypothetical protein